jgi:nitroimidazol reductase NimA-like FMN-containing flavoprotein (pyridoxamine 5'-phosphate oxidase superfamily)
METAAMSESDTSKAGEFKTARVTVRRRPRRGSYDYASIAAILDATFLCHVGFVVDGQPYVIPTAFGRDGKTLYIHGSAVSRMLKHLSGGVPVCVTATLLDGIVLARSLFNHSMNYRSVIVLGTAVPADGEEKLHGLKCISEHILAGRWAEARAPNEIELRATSVLKVVISEASAKVREGPPMDDEGDYQLSCWAGVVPIALRAGEPVPEEHVPANAEIPDYIRRFVAAT